MALTAPHIQVDVTPLVPESFQSIVKGDLDFALYAGTEVSDDLIAKKLFVDIYVLLIIKAHPLLKTVKKQGFLNPADITGYRQIDFNYPAMDRFHPDRIMRLEKTVTAAAFKTPIFISMPFLVANSNAAAPARLGAQPSQFANVQAVAFNQGASFSFFLLWQERGTYNPAITWFTDLVVQIVASDRNVTPKTP